LTPARYKASSRSGDPPANAGERGGNDPEAGDHFIGGGVKGDGGDCEDGADHEPVQVDHQRSDHVRDREPRAVAEHLRESGPRRRAEAGERGDGAAAGDPVRGACGDPEHGEGRGERDQARAPPGHRERRQEREDAERHPDRVHPAEPLHRLEQPAQRGGERHQRETQRQHPQGGDGFAPERRGHRQEPFADRLGSEEQE
jgi:hypothetical protein